jgi:hypothetical protein
VLGVWPQKRHAARGRIEARVSAAQRSPGVAEAVTASVAPPQLPRLAVARSTPHA